VKKDNNAKPDSILKESKAMVRHSIIYSLGNFMSKSIGFLMIPVYTRFLEPFEYGILELVSLTTEMAGMILTLRISRAMYRFYFEYDNVEDKNQVISTAMISFGMIGILGLILASLSSGFLAEKVLDSSKLYHYFIISFSSLWFGTINQMSFTYLQIRKKSTRYILFSSFRLIISLSLNIYFVVFLKTGVVGILYSNLISSAVMTLILSIPVLLTVGISFSKNKFKEMLKFSLPLIPGGLANFVVLVSDRFIVKEFGSLADAGIYSLSYKFGTLPHVFLTVPFFQIWSVRRFELFKDKSSEEVMGKIITYFVFMLVFLGLGISVLSQDVIKIMANEKFWSAYKYIPILILSYVVFGLFNHFAVPILIQKKTKYLSYIDIGNGIFTVCLNILLIRRYGIYGAAFATLICYTTRIIALYIISNRLQKIYFEFFRVGKIFFSAGIIFTFCYFVNIESLFCSLLIKFAIALLFPLVLYFLSFYNPNELSMVTQIVTERSLKAFWS